MLSAALTTAGGFALLGLSGIAPLRLFGQVFVLAIILAFLASIILVPTLISTRLKK
jgi:predicted RND superfamily exporter protein